MDVFGLNQRDYMNEYHPESVNKCEACGHVSIGDEVTYCQRCGMALYDDEDMEE